MYTATKGTVLPTTIAGSLPRSAWFTKKIAGRPLRAAMVDSLFREQYLDEVSTFIRDQERVGLDIVSDGDARFDNDAGGRSWISYVMERLGGVSDYQSTQYKYPQRNVQAMGSLLHEVHNSRMLLIVTGKIGPGHIELSQLWRCAQEMTSKPHQDRNGEPRAGGPDDPQRPLRGQRRTHCRALRDDERRATPWPPPAPLSFRSRSPEFTGWIFHPGPPPPRPRRVSASLTSASVVSGINSSSGSTSAGGIRPSSAAAALRKSTSRS